MKKVLSSVARSNIRKAATTPAPACYLESDGEEEEEEKSPRKVRFGSGKSLDGFFPLRPKKTSSEDSLFRQAVEENTELAERVWALEKELQQSNRELEHTRWRIQELEEAMAARTLGEETSKPKSAQEETSPEQQAALDRLRRRGSILEAELGSLRAQLAEADERNATARSETLLLRSQLEQCRVREKSWIGELEEARAALADVQGTLARERDMLKEAHQAQAGGLVVSACVAALLEENHKLLEEACRSKAHADALKMVMGRKSNFSPTESDVAKSSSLDVKDCRKARLVTNNLLSQLADADGNGSDSAAEEAVRTETTGPSPREDAAEDSLLSGIPRPGQSYIAMDFPERSLSRMAQLGGEAAPERASDGEGGSRRGLARALVQAKQVEELLRRRVFELELHLGALEAEAAKPASSFWDFLPAVLCAGGRDAARHSPEAAAAAARANLALARANGGGTGGVPP